MRPARTNPGLVPRPPGPPPVVGQSRSVTAEYVISTQMAATLQLAECRSRSGPLISLQAGLGLPALNARVTMRDRFSLEEATPGFSVKVPLVLQGERLERPLQTVRVAPGRPLFALRFRDRDHQPLAAPLPLSACTDGIRSFDVPVRLAVSSTIWVVTHGSSRAGGPKLWLSGKLVLSRGVIAQFGMRPAGSEVGVDETVTELPLFHPGTAFFFYERAVECGLPGDAWAWLRFLDERDAPIGEEQSVRPLSAA